MQDIKGIIIQIRQFLQFDITIRILVCTFNMKFLFLTVI